MNGGNNIQFLNRTWAAGSRAPLKHLYKLVVNGFCRQFDMFDRLYVAGFDPKTKQRIQNGSAYPAQHYGFTSYQPDGRGHAVVVPIQNSNLRVSVAEWMCGGPQDLQQGEVSLWSRDGQELRYSANGKIRCKVGVDNYGLPGVASTETGWWELEAEKLSTGHDLTVGRDAFVGRDLTTDHLISSGESSRGAVGVAPKTINATATGNGVSFDLTFDVANSQTLTAGDKIGTVSLARNYASAPRCVAGLGAGSWPADAAVSARATSGGTIDVYYRGATPIAGPVTGLEATVIFVGKS